MGPCFHHRRRVRALLAAVTVLTALSAAAVQVASAAKGKPPTSGQPCPSCPDRLPPTGSGGSGSGGGGTATGGFGSGASQTAPLQPLISLGGISLDGNVASVTGSVNLDATPGSSGDIKVTVNAKPIGFSASGDFSATSNVNANGNVTLRAADVSAGVVSTITVPSRAIPSGGGEVDALAQLEADNVTLMLPVDGFTTVDGVGTDAAVHVKGTAGIAGLDLNGVDLLASLKGGASSSAPSKSSGGSGSSSSGSATPKPGGVKPGSGSAPAGHHSASAPVSGHAKNVSLTVTGTNGATQTTTVRIQRVRTLIRFGRMTSVSAFGALGVKIGSVKFATHRVGSTGRIGVTVTVRDRRNYLVRDAVVMLQPATRGLTIRNSYAHMSNTLGRTTFSVSVASAALGHRLYVRVMARTPRSGTHVTASTFLCGCG